MKSKLLIVLVLLSIAAFFSSCYCYGPGLGYYGGGGYHHGGGGCHRGGGYSHGGGYYR